jgi:TldD protein
VTVKLFAQICLSIVVVFTLCTSFGQSASERLQSAVPTANEAVALLSSNVVIQTLEHELKRSIAQLKGAGNAPLYYLAYRLYEGKWDAITGSDGALENQRPAHWRMLAVDLRVGSPRLDNTHYLRSHRSNSPACYESSHSSESILPLNGAGISLQQCLWLKTDEAFKAAQQRFSELCASNEVYSVEEDKSGDFSLQRPHNYQSPIKDFETDQEQLRWQERVRRLSKLFLAYPSIEHSKVSFSTAPTTRYFVNSENSRIIEQHLSCTFAISGTALADDGMNLWLTDSIEVPDPALLPDDTVLKNRVEKLANSLVELRKAPIAEAFVGPAILSGKAAAVFFHETFGHRIEAIHEKNENEGKTFVKKIGTLVMPRFITVVDDPTVQKACGEWLNGRYAFDDEGAPAQRVTLVKNGVLTGFLVGRTPVEGVDVSNGHGRSSPGWNPTARQANLFISADKSKQCSPQLLRQMLISEAKRQHKPYGLLFDEISGGYTYTDRSSDQTYTVNPLRVYKVFVDGRPDQLIRGADIVGTPLAALERIITAGADYKVFNGQCGRESGLIPVSAVAPSLLIQSIEIKRTNKSFQKPPILPEPSGTRDSVLINPRSR